MKLVDKVIDVAGTVFLFGFVCLCSISGCESTTHKARESTRTASTSSVATPNATTHPSLQNQSSTQSPPLFRELLWTFADTGLGPTAVHITVPATASPTTRMPVLIALHGQGEARKSPENGALGWPHDYAMLSAIRRLNRPPLTRADFGDMIDAQRQAALNRYLHNHRWRGMIVVAPYIPDRFGKYLQQDAQIYGTFLTDVLLPKIYRELPAVSDVSATAIDGVSLGGRAAVYIGLIHADHFGAVGGIQIAISKKQIPQIVRLLESARAKRPHLAFRILTSQKDVYRKVNEALSRRLHATRQPHLFYVAAGNHSYEFNRGPGVYEMLLYHDATLRGEPFLGHRPF